MFFVCCAQRNSHQKMSSHINVSFPLQHLEVVSPFQLYFNPTLILRQYQLWRLATTFLFFGTIGFSFLFNMIFTYRYCRMLEEGSFRGRSSDFVMMFVFGGALMIVRVFAAGAVGYINAKDSSVLRLHHSNQKSFFRLWSLSVLNLKKNL